MGRIVAIGGGRIGRGTEAIDREIIALTGKKRPRAMFVPTASRDNVGYGRRFARVYGRLGCSCDVLYLLGRQPSRREIRGQIADADIIYVGGGNTLLMMRRWRFLGVDAALRKAHARGAVLCGASAGAICWFDNGHSDSMRGYGHDPFDYIRVAGLGLVKGTVCPHFHHDDREKDFLAMIARMGGFGIGIDDRCALEVVDGRYRVLSAGGRAKAWTVRRHRGRVAVAEIPRRKAFRPVAELYE
ncbi:MAG TPA: Type 1 glutamine amidotransferase-like domain-containing protein [Phycisphaerae bacterium]|nr:Type 1 glutamine amidotransferase-like domain-containing protein [Phycisphaerae bacterium]